MSSVREFKRTVDLRDLAQLSFQILSEEEDVCPSILALKPESPISLLNEETENTSPNYNKFSLTKNLDSNLTHTSLSTASSIPSTPSTTTKLLASKNQQSNEKKKKNPLPVESIKTKSSKKKKEKNWTSGMTGRVSWNERYVQLKEFKDRFGHCKVPYRWPENPPLGRWVGLMRKKKKEGTLDQQKVYALEILKFSWNLLGYKKRLRKEGGDAGEEEDNNNNDMDIDEDVEDTDNASEDLSSSGTDN